LTRNNIPKNETNSKLVNTDTSPLIYRNRHFTKGKIGQLEDILMNDLVLGVEDGCAFNQANQHPGYERLAEVFEQACNRLTHSNTVSALTHLL